VRLPSLPTRTHELLHGQSRPHDDGQERQYGWESLSALSAFAFAIYADLFLVLFVVYSLLLRVNGIRMRDFSTTAWPAIQLGFVSRSSIATLPVSERVVERLGVSPGYAFFAVPFAATTKMDGCAAIYPAIAAIFVGQYYGIALGPTDHLLIVVVSVFGSAATAGLTGAVVMLTLTLSTLGLPLEGAGLLLAIVAKRSGLLDGRQTDGESYSSGGSAV